MHYILLFGISNGKSISIEINDFQHAKPQEKKNFIKYLLVVMFV